MPFITVKHNGLPLINNKELEENTTFKDIKTLLKNKEHIPVPAQRLIVGGRVVPDNTKLNEISSDFFPHIILNIRIDRELLEILNDRELFDMLMYKKNELENHISLPINEPRQDLNVLEKEIVDINGYIKDKWVKKHGDTHTIQGGSKFKKKRKKSKKIKRSKSKKFKSKKHKKKSTKRIKHKKKR
jgi:hypothetical protein